jgi:serine/threonine-protein kinase
MANSKRLESGTIFGGTYKIIDFIGEGGMGHVYKVEHMLMEKLLALKILKSEYLTEALWKRFRAEGTLFERHFNLKC